MLKQFYEKALPSQGVYCVSGIDQATKKTTNRFAETLEDVFKLVDKLKGQKLNVFVALGSFDGFSRKADNCLFFRSLFIDLDVGEGKAYGDKGEAQTALWKFLGETGLPDPVCVDSGGGLHAYWLMDRDIPISEYLPYAHQFKAFVLDKIAADPSVMADAARIMRCPETYNLKYDPPELTSVIGDEITTYDWDEFKSFLDGEVPSEPTDVLAKVKKGLDEDTMAMKKLDNFEWDFMKIAERSLAGDGCAQVKYWLENAQSLGYDDWFNSMNIAYFCKDGDTMIHKVSEDHPDYTAKAVEEKKLEFVKRGKPQTCEYLASQHPDRCQGCKHRGKIHTPIVLGKALKEVVEPEPVAELVASEPSTAAEVNALLGTQTYEAEPIRETQSTQEIPKFPEFLNPFSRGQLGGIYFNPPPKTDKKGQVHYEDPVEILAHLLFPVRRLFSPLDGECMTMHLILPNDGLKEFLLPMKSVYALEELKKTLSFHQVIYSPKHINNIQEYLVKWSQYMINVGKAQQMRMQLGWSEASSSPEWATRSFVVGDKEITQDGELIEAPISPYIRGVAKHFRTVGTFERWQESANELNRIGFELHAMTCLAGFGTTLMSYMSTPGVVISLLGRSGCAKTGAMYAGISAFGDPDALSVFDATDNGLTGRMLGLKNLMFGIDEVGNKDPKPLSQLVHNVSNGKAKIKMQASVNAERVAEMTASLIAVLTTNESVYNKFEILKGSPDGEAARLIEFLMEQPNDLKGTEGAKLGVHIFDAFKYNYGHAGPMFIQQVYQEGDISIKKRIQGWVNRYLTDTGGDSAYRFHQNFVAAVFTAGEILNEAGIVTYDLERIYKRVIAELNNIKLNVVKVNSTDYSAILNDFIYENMGNILRIKDHKVIDEPRGKLVARVATDEPTRISKEALKEYLQKKKISPREFEKNMMESGEMLDKGAKKHLETGWKATTTTKATNVYLFKNSLELSDAESHSTN
jgi:hypothetical protein